MNQTTKMIMTVVIAVAITAVVVAGVVFWMMGGGSMEQGNDKQSVNQHSNLKAVEGNNQGGGNVNVGSGLLGESNNINDNVIGKIGDKEIIFSDSLLTIKTDENMPSVANLISEDMAVGYNVPSHKHYLLESKKYTDKMPSWISLDVYNLPMKATRYISINKNKNWKYIESLEKIQKVLDGNIQIDKGYDLIFPPPNAACVEARSVKRIDSDFLRGVRYITHCHQDYSAASGVHYVFQGISKDDLRHIVFSYSDVRSNSLEKYYKEVPSRQNDMSAENIEKTYDILDNERDENFLPSLFLIDEFVRSLRYKVYN